MLLEELDGAKVVFSGGSVFCGVAGIDENPSVVCTTDECSRLSATTFYPTDLAGMFGVVDCGKISFGCVESDFNVGEGGGFGGSGRRRVQRCWSGSADGLCVAKAIQM